MSRRHTSKRGRGASGRPKDLQQTRISSPSTLLRCPKCNATIIQTALRCTKCNASLRPTLLEFITSLGIITNVILFSAFLVIAIIKKTPSPIFVCLFSTLAVAIFIGLRYGLTWSWVAIHIAWAVYLGLFLISSLLIDSVLVFTVAAEMVIIILLLVYLHTKRVRFFCSVKDETKTFVVILSIAITMALMPFSLGKYFELGTPGPYDSGAYVYSAKHILDGAVIGVDEKPSAQLGTLLVNMLGVKLFGFSETGPKLIQGILQAAALVLMFIAIYKLFGTLPAAVSVIVASTYLSAPLIAKFGNVKEQYMIAFMVMAISCFVLRQLGGRWWWVVLAGVFVIWAPLFKQTGASAMAAIGLFVLIQPIFKHKSFKQTASDIGLLTAGAVIAIAPASIWLLTCHNGQMLPYAFIWKPIISSLTTSPQEPETKPTEPEKDPNTPQDKPAEKGLLTKLLPGYVAESWLALEPAERKEVARRVFRYYKLLILPIALAIGAIAVRIVRMINRLVSKKKEKKTNYDRFVFLFTVWWLLDMAFVWISPRSYEQYYLPLNASAAMLGAYLICAYTNLLANPVNKNVWRVVGFIGLLFIGLLFMIGMSWHIFFGIAKSPHSNLPYGEKRRGYVQKFKEVTNRKKGAKGYWEIAGQYIRNNSTTSDKIYVWGWVPGIYVQAQRLSTVPEAFEGTMHTLSPEALSKKIEMILNAFKKEPPKFIVDTHKIHFPWDRPPLELWPTILLKELLGIKEASFLPPNKLIIDRYNKEYSRYLQVKVEPDEALRYKAMQPFREYVMNNYQISEINQFVRTQNNRLIHRMFGENVVFKRK